ncbi:MAG: hypothetical protein OQK82_02880 [Candidatus Pacearchaeota archaeon]|nr:hypothetical protein [Candidatus Pacearchaeota archaeon]
MKIKHFFKENWKLIISIFFAIAIFTFKKYVLLIGGIFFLLLGLNFIFKKSKSILSGIIAISLALLFLSIYFQINISPILLAYILLIPTLASFIFSFIEKNNNQTIYDKIFEIIKIIIFLPILYQTFTKDIPNLLEDILSKGILDIHEYLFAILLPILLIIILANLTKGLEVFFKTENNPYLDISIGTIIFTFFAGYYLLTKLQPENQLMFFLGIITAIFLIVGTISSLKSIIKD